MLEVDNLQYDDHTRRPKKLRKHKKSKVGCPDCRRRKVKCDESLPACKRCINRGVKCGYLDYTERQLEMVKLAKWEADGSNPSTLPIQAQQYDPHKHIDIKVSPSSSNSSCNNNISNLTSTGLYENNYIIDPVNFEVPFSPYYTCFSSPYSSPKDSPSSISSQSFYHFDSDLPLIFDNKLQQESGPELSIPLIKHSTLFKTEIHDNYDINQHQNNSAQNYLHQILSQFASAKFSHYSPLFLKLFTDIRTFDACLLLSCSLISRNPNLSTLYLRVQGVCLRHILEGLHDLNDDNVIPILAVSVALDFSTLFLTDEINYDQRPKLSNGPNSILRNVYESPLLFPNSFLLLKNTKLYQIHTHAIIACYGN